MPLQSYFCAFGAYFEGALLVGGTAHVLAVLVAVNACETRIGLLAVGLTIREASQKCRLFAGSFLVLFIFVLESIWRLARLVRQCWGWWRSQER